MNRFLVPASLIACFACLAISSAADYTAKPLSDAPPADALSKEVIAQLAPMGVQVSRGEAKFCDLWFAKNWATVSGFQPTGEVAYPFKPGELIGVARFSKKSTDFRDQDIGTGVYTMRYAQQPVDGSHVGTSLTRDFVLLIEASKDKSPAPLEYKQLTKSSAEAAGSSHPALLSLRKASAETKEFPSIRHEEEHDWWIVAVQGNSQAKDKPAAIPLELVIVGHASE